MKILLLYDYPPSPSGLATQGDLLCRGLLELGIETQCAHLESSLEKEWCYRWFKPDLVVGVGYWGHTPQLILHPQLHGIPAVPWLVADGYVAHYQDVLNGLPLLLVTSNWVREMYIRDGIFGDNIEVLPVGCDRQAFRPMPKDDPKVSAVRETLGVKPDQLLIMTMGGDAASKGGREVMRALANIADDVPDWRYVCKVWPQPRTLLQNEADRLLAEELGIADKVIFATGISSRQFTPYLLNACDIYAAPSRLEGFGMIQVEAGACEKPVIGIKAMGPLDTMVHDETALLADVAQRIVAHEVTLGRELGFIEPKPVVFAEPRTVDYRADVGDIERYLRALMTNGDLRGRLGAAARKRAVEHFDYRVVAARFLKLIGDKLGIK